MLRMNMAVGEGDKHFSGPGSLKSALSPDPKTYLDQKIKRGITKMWLELESSKKGDKKRRRTRTKPNVDGEMSVGLQADKVTSNSANQAKIQADKPTPFMPENRGHKLNRIYSLSNWLSIVWRRQFRAG